MQQLAAWQKKAQASYIKEQAGAMKEVLAFLRRVQIEDQLWLETIAAEQFCDPRWRMEELLPRYQRQLALLRVRIEIDNIHALSGRKRKGRATQAAAPPKRKPGSPAIRPALAKAKATLHDVFSRDYAHLRRAYRAKRSGA